jgi:8-oxo-dGTP diphosphatase
LLYYVNMVQNITKVGVGIIVCRDLDGITQILLHRRHKVSSGFGMWGSGGGHLEYGESLQAAALRELLEEAGEKLVVSKVEFLGVSNFIIEYEHYVDITFKAKWVSGETSDMGSDAAVQWQWFDLDALPDNLFPVIPNYIQALKTGQNLFDLAS